MADEIGKNLGYILDIDWVNSIQVNEEAVQRSLKVLQRVLNKTMTSDCEIAWLLRAVSCMDLTTLGGDDTDSNVQRLCRKARRPLSKCLINRLKGDFEGIEDLTTGAVCVYPSRVPGAVFTINKMDGCNIPIASVATGFPSGQYPLETRLDEIRYCVSNGATEIDVVISRELVLTDQWEKLYSEIKMMKSACQSAHLKTILATGECGSLKNVYKASLVAMMAGSDFIKTSTGKESVNATLEVGLVMCRAILDYYKKTGYMVGLKPAGGIRTSKDAIAWLMLVKDQLGNEWLSSKLFRIGASGLLGDIEKRLFVLLYGFRPSDKHFTPT